LPVVIGPKVMSEISYKMMMLLVLMEAP
jgi:hypothetical protein